MKLLMSCVLFLMILPQKIDLKSVRETYRQSAENTEKTEQLDKILIAVTKNDKPALVAYKGAVIALKAKSAEKIKDKKEGFIEGVSWVEHAIEKHPNNLEARLIRLTIQENAPKILGYKKNIPEDKTKLLSGLKSISDSHLKNYIEDYILQSKVFTDEEKAQVAN
ncbi:hypothetical protein PK35_11800 [Tamlana nanhaiensis]|uniref:Uncharacterized protein n=1 Tax=Neotamlana nanhaiensis TaxID=1382798 RepID=A0A0D7VZL8_9FLAO|nr:hypothetical protein [Tamlana nanhaiensis]KJD32114.1 hypothetical protein PK35_10915 [Tamlana nanhaiensis]KJD32276.1 hypothetical protein PK35_11800 [Tamlana nanhaiensis]